MDSELKTRLDSIEQKLDTAIAHQQEICKLKHDPINVHLTESPTFRDKIVKAEIWIVACWTIMVLILGRVLWGALSALIK